MALRLINGEGCGDGSAVGAMRLDARTRRPGVAHEEFELFLDRPAAEHVLRAAARDGLPEELFAVIAIESERALSGATPGGQSPVAVARRLDWEARRAQSEFRPTTQLAAYAALLREARSRKPTGTASALELLVPYHTLHAWKIAAGGAGVSLGDWARAQLVSVGTGRRLWEAAAAEAGEMLAGWVALRAIVPTSAA